MQSELWKRNFFADRAPKYLIFLARNWGCLVFTSDTASPPFFLTMLNPNPDLHVTFVAGETPVERKDGDTGAIMRIECLFPYRYIG